MNDKYKVITVGFESDADTEVLGTISKSAAEIEHAGTKSPIAVHELRPDLVIVCENNRDGAGAWIREFTEIHEGGPSNRTACIMLLADDESGWTMEAAFEVGADDYCAHHADRAGLEGRVRALARLGRLHRSLAGRREDTAALLELTATLTSSLDIRDILRTVVKRVAELASFGRVSIVLAPMPEQLDVGFVLASSDDDDITNLKLDLRKYPEIQQVLRTGEPLFIDDVRTHPALEAVREDTQWVGAMSLFPISWEEEAMGALFLRSGTEGLALNDRQRYFCEVTSQATGVALRNARVLQSLRDHTQEISFAKTEAERELKSLERYADLFKSAAEGIAVIDRNGSLLFANPRGYEIARAHSEALQGRRLLEWVAPNSQATVREMWERITRGEYPRGVDIELCTPDGGTVCCSCSFAPLVDDAGSTLLSFMDVTDQRLTEGELKRTKEFLEGLINASVDGIIAAKMDGMVLLFNPGAERLYGLTAEEVIGRMNVKDLYRGDEAFHVMERLRSEEYGGRGRLGPVRLDITDSRGATVPISLTAALIYDDDEPIASFGIFTDLRERVRVEQRLAHTQEKLAISEKQAVIAEVAGTTAHELNQPLTSVTAYCDLLMQKLDRESAEYRAASIIAEETSRMAEIVRKIGKMTRYETTSYVGEQRILDLDRASTSSAPPANEGPEL